MHIHEKCWHKFHPSTKREGEEDWIEIKCRVRYCIGSAKVAAKPLIQTLKHVKILRDQKSFLPRVTQDRIDQITVPW